jgi:uncharacterized membrane protein YcaP (DUF421 family)
MAAIDWHTLLVPRTSLLELFLRGTVMYLLLFALLRILVRRHMGAMSIMDMLMIVLIADAAQNAMAGEYKSISEGLLLCGTIVGWSVFLDWLCFRFAFARRWLEPPPLPLIWHGKIQHRNLRQELITKEELISQLRQQGIEDIHEIKSAHIEPDGQFSIIRKPGGSPQQSNRAKQDNKDNAL